MKKFSAYLFLLLTTVLVGACDEDTVTIGSGVMPDFDIVSTSQATFTINSKSVRIDSVMANTNECYLGSIVDPETRSKTTCDFLAQYHLLDDYVFPSEDKIVKADGRPLCDTCRIRLFFNSYYGDSLTAMKVSIQELDTNRVMEEGVKYYTDIDPTDYISPTSDFSVSTVYTVKDLSTSSSGSSKVKSIVIDLPKEYGQNILEKYYQHPQYFKNSYQFIRHVCPGFYFKTDGGVGSMVNIHNSVLDIHFKFHSTTSAGNDTIYDGWQRTAATEEVIQNTHIENTIPASLLDETNEYTYIKSPTGIFTELELPISDIVAGEHYGDTINSAKVAFARYNNDIQSPYNLEPPTTVMLIRKDKMFSFFENAEICDDITSYIADYTSTNNAYVFTNIAPLLTLMKNERDAGAGVAKTESEAVRNAKYAQWEASHPDWNKVMLIPVSVDYATTSSTSTVRTLLRVRNDLSLSSVKLVGGPDGAIPLDITYSSFDKK